MMVVLTKYTISTVHAKSNETTKIHKPKIKHKKVCREKEIGNVLLKKEIKRSREKRETERL